MATLGEHAYDALQAMPASRWLDVVDEEFVTDPGRELERVLAFLGLEADRHAQEVAVRDVHGGSVGKGRAALDEATVARLTALVGRAWDGLVMLADEEVPDRLSAVLQPLLLPLISPGFQVVGKYDLRRHIEKICLGLSASRRTRLRAFMALNFVNLGIGAGFHAQ